MPAVSKSQQRFFGMVHAYKKGELNTDRLPSSVTKKIKKTAATISDKEAVAFASSVKEAMRFGEYLSLLETLHLQPGDKVTPTGGEFAGQVGTVEQVGTNDRRWMVTVSFGNEARYWIPAAALKRAGSDT